MFFQLILVTSTVEHIILEVVCNLDERDKVSGGDYLLQVAGTSEYLEPDSQLQDYECVHECYKYDRDPEFVLMPAAEADKPYLRTVSKKSWPLQISF